MAKSQLGKNLRLLRNKFGLSQQELAEELALNRNQVASYESGLVEPRPHVFVNIANYFQVSPTMLLHADLQRWSSHSPGGTLPRQYIPELQNHLRELISRTDDIEKVMEGFREYYKLRVVGGNIPASSGDLAFEHMLTLLESLLAANRRFVNRFRP